MILQIDLAPLLHKNMPLGWYKLTMYHQHSKVVCHPNDAILIHRIGPFPNAL